MPTADPGPDADLVHTCVLATTPASGGRRLAAALAANGSIGAPRAWFDPLQVPFHGRRMKLSVQEPDWPARYLTAVRAEATTGSVCAVSMTWSEQRWLRQVARIALDPQAVEPTTLDSDVLAAWFPEPRYAWVRTRDAARQALRWYAAEHAELRSRADATAVDLQEVRWLETLIGHQERAWETYFRLHRIEPVVVYREDLVADPQGSAALAAAGLRLHPAGPLPDGFGAEPADRAVDRWVDAYRRARPRLRTQVGVRAVGR